LAAVVKAADQLKAANYTPASYKTVADAVAAAKKVLANPAATQTQVDAAQAAVTKAIAKLVAAKPAPAYVTKVKFGQSKVTIAKGTKVHLKAAVYYTKGSPTYTAGVTYKSSNTKVATVDKYGRVTAKKAGTAKITATSNKTNAAGKKLSASYSVKVVAKKSKAKVAGVSVTNMPKSIKVGQTVYLNGSYTGTAQSVKITYSTSKYLVATVDSAGRLLGLTKGTDTVVVKAGGKTKKYTITVK
jgi:uncharacterized protein YjdB